MAKYLVLGASRYDFVNDRKEQISGAKVIYIDQPEVGPNRKGYVPLNVPAESVFVFDSFVQLPGIYNLDFRMRADGKGKPTLVLTSAEFIEPVLLQ